MTISSPRKPTRHDRKVVTKPPRSGPIAAAIAADAPDQRVDLLLRRALEVAVDQRLHRGQQQRCAEAADRSPRR